MKKIKTLLIAAVLALLSFSLVACYSVIDFEDSKLGDKLPDSIGGAQIPNKINGNMSALDMYNAGMANYYAMQYVGTQQIGDIVSKAVGLNVNQRLVSNRIKDGNKYYLDSSTITLSGIKKVNLIDEIIYVDGQYKVRSADKIDVKDGVGTVTKWKDTVYYDNIEDAVKDYPNDPTKMNLYIINEQTIKSATKPVYDQKTDQWTFTFVMDPVAATKDYINNMYYNISNDKMVAGSEITFTSLKLDVVMWGNGLIKSIANDETYQLSFMGTKTNLVGTTRFTYDTKELPISNYINRF